MPANVEQHTTSFAFGTVEGTPPTISGMSVRDYAYSFELQVNEEAINGEGMTEGRVMTKADSRKIMCQITGYIPSSTGAGGANNIGNSFTATVNGVSRFFTFVSVSEPRKRGKLVEVDVNFQSDILITS